jgi:hypothetical protein
MEINQTIAGFRNDEREIRVEEGEKMNERDRGQREGD